MIKGFPEVPLNISIYLVWLLIKAVVALIFAVIKLSVLHLVFHLVYMS